MIRSSVLFLFLALGLANAGCQPPHHLYKNNRLLMGTVIEVTSPDKSAAGIVFSQIQRIESIFSKYDPQSEISRLNKNGESFFGEDSARLLNISRKLWQLSAGGFDITVGPLMDAWGFTDHQFKVPPALELNKALGRVGFDKIIFDNSNSVVKFSVPGMKIDFGGIAKGYGVDCAVSALKKSGIKSCLINAGGQIYCLGDNFGRPWKIGIRDPRKPGVFEYLELRDKAVATSGDYEQYFFSGGKRYSHIMDPRTGYPVESEVIAVTVIADDSTIADGLSTSIFVLGKEKGGELAKRFPGVIIRIICESDLKK